MKLLLLIAATLLTFGQSEDRAFEFATIKQPNPDSPVVSGISAGPRRFTEIGTLRELIQTAYAVQDYQVSGGPSWLGSERFEVDGRTANPASHEQMMHMLQTLLSDRFKLATHRETKELPVYLLTATKNGSKLHRITDDTKAGGMSAGRGMLRGQLTLADFARHLSPTVGRPVIDRTGLTAVFEIDLKWSPDESSDSGGASVFTALQEQLGLKLESAKGPVEILRIGHAEKPSDN